MSAHETNLLIQTSGDVTLVSFLDISILSHSQIRSLGDELLMIAAQKHVKNLLLDFHDVRYLSSEMLGTLVAVYKRIFTRRGRLRLCSMEADLLQLLDTLGLDRVFEIYPDQESALASFGTTRGRA